MPDRFDPLMDLGTTKDKGTAPAPSIPGDSPPNPMAQRFDGAANFGTDGHDIVIGNPNIAGAAGGPQRQPANVSRFDGSGGLSNTPPPALNYEEDNA